MHGYGRHTDLLSQTYIFMIEQKLALQTLIIIIVQTIIHHCSKIFTTGQARAYNIFGCVGCPNAMKTCKSICSSIKC